MEELSEEQVTDGEGWDITTCLLRVEEMGGRSVNFEFNGFFSIDTRLFLPSMKGRAKGNRFSRNRNRRIRIKPS